MALCLRMLALSVLAPWSLLLLTSCGSGDDAGGGGGGSLGGGMASIAPGGFVEAAGSAVRPRWTTDDIRSFIPSGRGTFTFPAPYNTEGIRVTTADDCGGADCVRGIGYSYWRNMNNHVGSNEILIFLGLTRARGGSGPTLFSYDKSTDQIRRVGPIFGERHRLSGASTSGWYFSARLPTKLYLHDGPRMVRHDVMTGQSEVLFDVTAQFGSNRDVWQMSSSNDDLVHAATLRVNSTGEYLGCLVYLEATKQVRYYPRAGKYDECHVDRSGRYVLILEQLDGRNGLDNRYIYLESGAEERVMNLPGVGSVGHFDLGYGYVVGGDNSNALPNAAITWSIAPLVRGPVLHRGFDWNVGNINHITHTNARADVPREQQYACGSNADRARTQNELLCFRLDGSLTQLVVAPLMANLDAPGGADSYERMPKGNLDITGQYFIWTANLGGNRLDAFIVKVPAYLLYAS